MESNADGRDSLSCIARQHGQPVVSLLVDIGNNAGTAEKRTLGFLQNLECLQLPQYDRKATAGRVKVLRETIDATRDFQYLALSYTWHPSKHERKETGSYLVQERSSQEFTPSAVRNCALDRIFHYMRAINVDHLWIDQHSIIQNTDGCDDVTCVQHPACVQRREGFTVMDFVYKLSNHPVGLLARPIKSAWELKLLSNLLQGSLTTGDESDVRLSPKLKPRDAWMVVNLLRRITNDDWWRRGWIFQENYKAGTDMKLLIKHPKKLESLKRSWRRSFGSVDGELCILSVQFFEETTRLCLAFLRRIDNHQGPCVPPWMRKGKRMLQQILHRAGRYQYLLTRSQPMTPRIIADIDKKKITKPWDVLAIIANSCGYAVRFNAEKLRWSGASLSLAILAQCILNGEVLHNGGPPMSEAADLTVTKYLERALFSGFYRTSPKYSLTLNKSCRFIDASFSVSGIHTHGHVWKLGKIISTRDWPVQGAWVDFPHGKLELIQRRRLAYLAKWLEGEHHGDLADNIRNYLRRDYRCAGVSEGQMSFTERYMRAMAEEIADAIERGDPLALGCLYDTSNPGRYNPYMALFLQGDQDGCAGGVFAFTASRPEDASSDRFDTNDLDRHVSFQVAVEGRIWGQSWLVPTLRIRRWLPGMCFFKRIPREEVVFPWPSDLKGILA
ncbi:hypothetical protein B0T18DRAFT_409467 [Schizothecium vesticola]|uniref:Heterokaryon incompatibility domain-containing protein n=1 Tax=Schizothecium vesticola TaxID=314040 RepID=A0AA40EU30_9PEZI|nr:hypothetical protein B0T18DRAFT_409467 [Schizothecium vesticola]